MTGHGWHEDARKTAFLWRRWYSAPYRVLARLGVLRVEWRGSCARAVWFGRWVQW